MADEHIQQDHTTALAGATARHKTLTIPLTDNMMEAAELLRQLLPKSQYNALWEAIVHIESMDLTDADMAS